MTSRRDLEMQLAAITTRLNAYDAFPADDPYKDGQAVKFKWQSPTSGRSFNYVALRAAGKWYTTGRESAYARLWPAFVEWLLVGQTRTLEPLVPRAKYDRKLAKARAAANITAAQFNANRAASVQVPDATDVKDLFEDLVALRVVYPDKPDPANISTPIIDRVLGYARKAINEPYGQDAATFLAALARYEKVSGA